MVDLGAKYVIEDTLYFTCSYYGTRSFVKSDGTTIGTFVFDTIYYDVRLGGATLFNDYVAYFAEGGVKNISDSSDTPQSFLDFGEDSINSICTRQPFNAFLLLPFCRTDKIHTDLSS